MAHAKQVQGGWTARFRKAFIALASDTSIYYAYYSILSNGKDSKNSLSSISSAPLTSLDLVRVVQHLWQSHSVNHHKKNTVWRWISMII